MSNCKNGCGSSIYSHDVPRIMYKLHTDDVNVNYNGRVRVPQVLYISVYLWHMLSVDESCITIYRSDENDNVYIDIEITCILTVVLKIKIFRDGLWWFGVVLGEVNNSRCHSGRWENIVNSYKLSKRDRWVHVRIVIHSCNLMLL